MDEELLGLLVILSLYALLTSKLQSQDNNKIHAMCGDAESAFEYEFEMTMS